MPSSKVLAAFLKVKNGEFTGYEYEEYVDLKKLSDSQLKRLIAIYVDDGSPDEPEDFEKEFEKGNYNQSCIEYFFTSPCQVLLGIVLFLVSFVTLAITEERNGMEKRAAILNTTSLCHNDLLSNASFTWQNFNDSAYSNFTLG